MLVVNGVIEGFFFFSESAEISYYFETFTFTGLSFKRVR